MSELALSPRSWIAEYGPGVLPVPVLTCPDGSALTEDDETPEPALRPGRADPRGCVVPRRRLRCSAG